MSGSPRLSPDHEQPPGEADVRRQLERILAHPLFQSSARLTAFLRLIVGYTLAGRAHELKESVIGADVFGLGDAFNPRENPIVRIVAGRLRSKLAEYYLGQGLSDPVFIEIPKGGYVPRFFTRNQPPSDPMSTVQSGLRGRTSVGRDRELGCLWSAFAGLTSGGAMCNVTADAGMGKTTLGEDFLAGIQLQASPSWIGRGTCSERLAETDAYLPIIESLQAITRGKSGAQALEVVKEVAPTWCWHISPLAGDPRPLRKEQKPASRERMRREIKDLFQELSRTASIVLFLDDLHWADISTCDLLAYLGGCLPQLRLLILMTCRPTRTNAFLRLKLDLERRGICQEMPLPFLTLSDIREYIDRRFPRNQFPPEFAVLVHQRTDGNPLFMIDLLRFLRDRRVLEERNGTWTVGQPLQDAAMIVPDGIGSMIKLKLDQLTADDLQLLSIAAVQGIQFDSSVLAQVLARSPADVEERLQELDTACNLVRTVEEREYNQVISVRCRFVHTYYQNALYGALAPSRRAEYSLAVAEALVALTGGTSRAVAADVAMLFEGGRDHARAALHFFHAARNAARLFAYPEAVILCEHGLRVLKLTPESRERDAQELGLRLILNLALMATRGYAAPEVEASHRRSLELCRKCQETRRLPAVLWGLHTCEVNHGQLIDSLELAHQLEVLAQQTQDTATTIQSLHALGTSLAFMGRLTEAHDVLARIFAVEAASPQPSGNALFLLDARVTSTSMLARLLTYLGHLDQALERAAASLEHARSLAHPQSIAYATFWVGWIRHAIGDHAESCRYLEVAMNLSQEYGLALILEWGRVVRGSAWAHLGRVDEAIGEIRESIRRQLAMGSLLERSYCLTLLAEALGLQGSYSEAMSLCGEALEFAHRTEGRSYEAETHRVRGELMRNLGGDNLPLVPEELEKAIHIARERECRLLELRAAVSYYRIQQSAGSPSVRPLLTSVVAWFGNQTFPILSEARSLLQTGTIP